METKLTIGERLKDLRVERDMNQKDVENQAGIPTSTLSTYENDTVGNVNVAAITKLAEFYEVQPEYLLCLTDNKKRPDASIQDLHLSDGLLDILLKDKTLNHRLLCELVEHPGFRQLMMDLEIYVNGLVSDRIRDANAMLEAMRQLICEKYDEEADVEMRTLQVGQLVEDEYFGRTIYEELSAILKDIRTAHITDDTTSDGSAIDRVRQSIESAKSFEGSAEEQQLRALCKQVGKDFDSLNKADVAATMRILRELTPTTTQQGRAVRKSMDKQLRGKTRRKR